LKTKVENKGWKQRLKTKVENKGAPRAFSVNSMPLAGLLPKTSFFLFVLAVDCLIVSLVLTLDFISFQIHVLRSLHVRLTFSFIQTITLTTHTSY
jgi:hypothetical protein